MARESVEGLIAEGRAAFERGDAAASLSAYEEALAERESGELFEGLARACYLAGDYRAAMDAYERAFVAFRKERSLLSAARAARMLAWLHGTVNGDWAVFGGWLSRASRLLEDTADDGLGRGWVEFMRATQAPYGVEREQLFRAASGLGRQLADPDLEYAALARLGEGLVLSGRVEEGMLCFDEALTAVCAGEVEELYVIEGVFCGMFLACERAHDVVRAEQWIRVADDISRRRNLIVVGAFCKAHYGGILTAAGRWDEAEAELSEAAKTFSGGYDASREQVLLRLADLRVRQGRLEEASVLLEGLDQHPDATRPFAALWLARGETARAQELLERKLADAGLPAPTAGPLLMLLVDAHLGEGSVSAAEEAAVRLAGLAERSPSHYLEASAALAKGKVCIASGAGDAIACLRDALGSFSLAQMPIELAQTRLELAKAAAEAEPEVAIAEAKAALEVFERRRAARDADAAAALLRSLGGAGRSAPRRGASLTKREQEVLELLGHGLSNPEIAERLFIAPKTAEHHVGNVLAKLDLRNRAEAAAYAARTAGGGPGSE